MRKNVTQAQCASFLPCNRALLWETHFCMVQVYTTQVWLIRVKPPNPTLVHEWTCDPRLPLPMILLFYVYGRKERKELRGQEGMNGSNHIESQDLVISKLRSKVPNVPGCGQMSQSEILIRQAFKRKYIYFRRGKACKLWIHI